MEHNGDQGQVGRRKIKDDNRNLDQGDERSEEEQYSHGTELADKQEDLDRLPHAPAACKNSVIGKIFVKGKNIDENLNIEESDESTDAKSDGNMEAKVRLPPQASPYTRVHSVPSPKVLDIKKAPEAGLKWVTPWCRRSAKNT